LLPRLEGTEVQIGWPCQSFLTAVPKLEEVDQSPA
jgi:hypothetical protein